MARAEDTLLEGGDERVAGKRAPRAREVGGRGAIELAEAADVVRGEPLRPPARRRDERVELVPHLAALADELL